MGVVSFYMVVSLALVFANKIMMKNMDFPYPLFLSWAQWILQEVCVVVGGFLSPRYRVLIFSSLILLPFLPLWWD